VMTEGTANPFGGEGGLDMNALLQQAQQMQQHMMEAQAELESSTVEGTSGGGIVTVTITGTGALQKVAIKPGSFDPDDSEDLAVLGDLIVAAFRSARGRADALAAEKLGPFAGGLAGGLGDVLGDGSHDGPQMPGLGL
jgi:DNA-binding YbaB/EbfC family protein